MSVTIPRVWSRPRLDRRLVEGSTFDVHRSKRYRRRWRLAYGRRMGAVRDGRMLAAELQGFYSGFEDGEDGAEGGNAGDHNGEIFFDAGEPLLVSLLGVREGF